MAPPALPPSLPTPDLPAKAEQAGPLFRRFRAPSVPGSTLVDPAWQELPPLLHANHRRLESSLWEIAGASLSSFASSARQELIAAAHHFTSQFCDVARPAAKNGPVVVSGHQPELFHSGVWFKNFALNALATDVGGVGVHLLIDSDLCRQVSVRTPTGPVDSPSPTAVAYDIAAPDTPYEERAVGDRELMASFGDRVAEALSGLIDEPLALAMSPDMVEAARETGNLGLTLSRARRLVEQRWGSATLELPFSVVCDSVSFGQFVSLLLHDLPALHEAYNGALGAYRIAHRLRTPAQPIPDLQRAQLQSEGGWWEVPLWVWTTDDPERRPLFARRHRSEVQLTNLTGTTWIVGGDDEIAAGIADLRKQGVKIRSRALITTLYSRLVLGDLFLHGIGGAKYDQVTDEFARRLFGFAPPSHATLTATLSLPIEFPGADLSEETRLRQILREMRYHPETFLDEVDSATARLIARKREAIARGSDNDAGDRRLRHQTIEQVNQALQPLLENERRMLQHERESLGERLHATAILGSREHSFCLFPEAWLQNAMRQLIPTP